MGAAAVAAGTWLAGGALDPGSHALAWQADRWALPWTWWTAAWVPATLGSLVGNLMALAALAVVGSGVQAGRASAAALAAAWPLGTLGLLLWPGVPAYVGLGGAIHAAAMVLWAHAALRPALKPLSLLLFVAMGLKLLTERAWSQPVAFDPEWGVNMVHAAHLSGAIAGALCGLVAESLDRLLRPSGPGPA